MNFMKGIKFDNEHYPQIFAPLINHHAWGVKRIHGTLLHLEFGAPHHEIREPLKPTPHLSEEARRQLIHRRVYLHGVYTLIIHYADYVLKTHDYYIDTKISTADEIDAALKLLDGQILLKTEQKGDYLHFYFDLDAEFIVFMPKNDDDSDMWEIVHNNISRVSYNTQTGFNAT